MREVEVFVGGVILGWCSAGCGPVVTLGDGTSSDTGASSSSSTGVPTSDDVVDESGIFPDLVDTGDATPCYVDGSCPRVDLLFVIDNSGTMGEEQLQLSRSFQHFVDELSVITGLDGQPAFPDVNIMVTTTDFGHPLCTDFQKPDYQPAMGAPIYTGCNQRINRFTGLDPMAPEVIEEACTENCPFDILPSGHFINFSGEGANVPDDDPGAALSCMGPQGIDGCGYESPLETMLQALNESACWNDPSQPACDDDPEWADVERGFLRDDSIVAVVVVTDELDCSVNVPGGYSYFTDVGNTVYWNINPELEIPQATSAICFNAGVSCVDADGDGIYEACDAVEGNEVLHPVGRYTSYLEYLEQQHGRDVVMLGVVGVPQVVARNPDPPYEPIAGGVLDLVHHTWVDAPYPVGDILPDEWNSPFDQVRAEHKIFELGALAPGCTGQDATGAFTGQGLPPVRLREVCESLDTIDDATGEVVVRCSLESICDVDYAGAAHSLAGLIAQAIAR